MEEEKYKKVAVLPQGTIPASGSLQLRISCTQIIFFFLYDASPGIFPSLNLSLRETGSNPVCNKPAAIEFGIG